MTLVRPRAWWFNKVPFSVMLVLLLADGNGDGGRGLAVLGLVVLTVCAAANYGYAINEIHDVEEDGRAGRGNAATVHSARRLRVIAAASAAVALASAQALAGVPAAALTAIELALPLAYSVPPVRLKERGWLGVGADALAAHVYPVLLALLAVDHWSVRPVTTALSAAVVAWAATTGVRGILAHQLASAEADRAAGLTTVAHTMGSARLERVIVGIVLPAEVTALALVVTVAGVGPVAWVLAGVYVAFELLAPVPGGRNRTTLLYNFYKLWAPLTLALDAGLVAAEYLAVISVYALLFAPHVRAELGRTAGALLPKRL
jgi:4-hydroxybenzoate polyprenyltransferase